MRSFLDISMNSDFSIYNIPFGIAKIEGKDEVVTRLGEHIVRLVVLAENDLFSDLIEDNSVFTSSYLNDFIALGKPITTKVRESIQKLYAAENQYSNPALTQALVSLDSAAMQLPLRIGDYTDFYSSIEHATNVGRMFRGEDNALLPNWKHLPVAYHGRASSIVVSGTPFTRPKGQLKNDNEELPYFAPTRLLDFELEMAFVIGKSNDRGIAVSIDEAEDHIFGLTLFNDWSARDIQKWEYVPLGPFLAKNFLSTVSPWIVTLEALEPFRVKGPQQEPEVLPYLKHEFSGNFDIELFVDIQPEGKESTNICHSNYKYMYWSMAQQLAHHTVGGCNMNIGDLCGSGTISGPTKSSFGSMLELTWRGTEPLVLKDGSERKFILDGDTVTLRGYAKKGDIRVGFGEATGKVLPAN